MYNVRLNRPTLQNSRAFIETFVANQSVGFSCGTVELLNGLLRQAETGWDDYDSLAPTYTHVSVFALASKSITLATVAAELVQKVRYPLFLEHTAPAHVATDDETRFVAGAENLLNLLRRMVVTLKKPSKTSDAAGVNEHVQSLHYALHVAQLGLAICRPDHFAFQLVQTADWLQLVAKVQRQIAAAAIEQARINEAAAAKAQGQTRQ